MTLKPISSSDLKRSRSFKDINMSILKNPFSKDIASVTNEESIKQSIKNIVLTAPGEKLFNPKFGSNVYNMLFEPLDPFMIDSLQVEILNTIKNYEKRVEVTNLRCIPDYDLNSVTVSLEYRIVGLPITETIQFVLQRPS
jgi:phage baseplate assembly protein W|tara:strand:- start:348 stop:767 length:420 start_codon:yes stop_codon:yes gene_type:complete